MHPGMALGASIRLYAGPRLPCPFSRSRSHMQSPLPTLGWLERHQSEYQFTSYSSLGAEGWEVACCGPLWARSMQAKWPARSCKSSSGGPCCIIRPPSMTTTLSHRITLSSWCATCRGISILPIWLWLRAAHALSLVLVQVHGCGIIQSNSLLVNT